MVLQRFSASLWLLFHSLTVFCRAKVLHFHGIQLINYFLSWLMLLGLYLKTQHQVPGHLDFLLDYLLGLLQFTSRSVIHFE